LLNHALATLGRRLAGRPTAHRIDKAREAVQETLLRALQKRHEYDPTRPVGPWLHGIMAHVLFEATRSLVRAPAQESADADAWERMVVDPAPDAAAEVLNRLAALQRISTSAFLG
jgi:DNA-directed RNA polymerase specialized sigma24 family protein